MKPKAVVLKPHVPNEELHTLPIMRDRLEKCMIEKYLLALERDPHLHFHAQVYTDNSNETLRYHLKKQFGDHFKIAIKAMDIQDEARSLAYMMKEDNYTTRNMPQGLLHDAKSISFNPKQDYAHWRKSLEDKYEQDPTYGFTRFVREYLHGHIHVYNRNVNKFALNSYFTKIRARNDKSYFNELVDYFIAIQ